MTSDREWTSLLAEWNSLLLHSPEVLRDLGPDGRRRAWLGEPGASEADLRGAEERLHVKLPTSYRSFLACSNGWACPGPSSMSGGALRSASRICRFERENRDWIVAYTAPVQGAADVTPEEHVVYGKPQDSCRFRTAYLWECIQISDDRGSGVYLLNPAVKTTEGEWEAWFFANWLPGAQRYPSFRALVEVLVDEARTDRSGLVGQ